MLPSWLRLINWEILSYTVSKPIFWSEKGMRSLVLYSLVHNIQRFTHTYGSIIPVVGKEKKPHKIYSLKGLDSKRYYFSLLYNVSMERARTIIRRWGSLIKLFTMGETHPTPHRNRFELRLEKFFGDSRSPISSDPIRKYRILTIRPCIQLNISRWTRKLTPIASFDSDWNRLELRSEKNFDSDRSPIFSDSMEKYRIPTIYPTEHPHFSLRNFS